MKPNLKDLLRHKFPMDKVEQAILLKEISDLTKELQEKLEYFRHLEDYKIAAIILKEIIGEED